MRGGSSRTQTTCSITRTSIGACRTSTTHTATDTPVNGLRHIAGRSSGFDPYICGQFFGADHLRNSGELVDRFGEYGYQLKIISGDDHAGRVLLFLAGAVGFAL